MEHQMYRTEEELLQLNVGDFVGILTTNMGDKKLHWTLGTVETPPYMHDVEIRLWEKQRSEFYNEDEIPMNEETEVLMNRIATVKGELQKSIDEADALTQQLRARRASIVQQIGEADNYVAESRAVMHAARDDVESIPDRHWQELKSYRIPPKMVSIIIRAVMLLLSEDEARTWPQMQRVLRDIQFKSRITNYDPDQQLSPERREYILRECVSKRGFRYDRAMQGSVAVGPIYYWVLAQLDVGEAQSQKAKVSKEAVERQKELRQVLKDISNQQTRIAEYQELMDDLDDQLRTCHQHAARSPSRSPSASRSRRRTGHGASTSRYQGSFAYGENKDYLRPAFYTWRPTDRVIVVLRKNIVSNFGGVTTQEAADGYNMSDAQIRAFDEALRRRMERGDQSPEEEDAALERDMFQQREEERVGSPRNDEEIMHERAVAAAEGKPTLIPSPSGMHRAETTDKLVRRFEGKSWQRVLDRKRMAIVNTFTEESAECLEVPEYYISINDLMVGSLVVDFDVQHDGIRSTKQLQKSVDNCAYVKMHALYDEEDKLIKAEDAAAASDYQVKFCGDLWADILPGSKKEITDAFLDDTEKATGIPRDNISASDIRVEGHDLTIDYTVIGASADPEEVQEMVDCYDYPTVWGLYQSLAEVNISNAAGTLHEVPFRGARWEGLVHDNELAIRTAFIEDSAAALNVGPRDITVGAPHFENNVLHVPYKCAACKAGDRAMDKQTTIYKYPKVWALYDRLIAEAAGAAHQKSFKGEYWETVLAESEPALTKAFCDDTAKATGVKVSQVDARSLDTDDNRLLVSYNLDKKDKVDGAAINDKTANAPYKKVWALYNETAKEQKEGLKNMSKSFEGEAWPPLCKSDEKAIRNRFASDACEALGANAGEVKVLGVQPTANGMTVQYAVSQPEATKRDVQQKTDASDFPRVWRLYDEKKDEALRRLRGGRGETVQLERRFQGDDWDILVDGCPEELGETFRKDAAKALNIRPSQVRVCSIEVGSLIVKYVVTDPELGDDEVNRIIQEHEFPELNALYRARIRAAGGGDGEEGARSEAGGDNEYKDLPSKVLIGDNWEEVLRTQLPNVEDAFKRDTADALGMEDPESVVIKRIRADDEKLIVDYEMKNCPYEEREVVDRVEDFPYPAVWELYPMEEDEAVTAHQVGFDGDDWRFVLQYKRDELNRAFVGCTADIFDLPTDHVCNAVYTLGSLTVDFELVHPYTLTVDEINKRVSECPYEPVWALCARAGEMTRTSHEVAFEGVGWEKIIAEQPDAVKRAFTDETAAALDIEPNYINVKVIDFADKSLVVRAEVQHSALQDEDVIQHNLTNYPYEKLWGLYPDNDKERGLEASAPGLTSHQVGFDGDDWKYVVDHNQPQLKDAFVKCTLEAVSLAPEALTKLRFTVDKGSLLVDFELEHSPYMTEDAINSQLADCPYNEVWAFYGEHPYDPDELVQTAHEVAFEGDEWRHIVQDSKDELIVAVVADTADALGVEASAVTNPKVAYANGALVANMDVTHSVLQDEDLIQEQLSSYSYDRVWEVYQNAPVYSSDEDEKGLAGGYPGESAKLERRFKGDDWDILVDNCPNEINKAFQRDAAKALNMRADQIRVCSAELGSLVVKYVVMNPEQDDGAIDRLIQGHDFPELNALYRARIRAAGAGGEGDATRDLANDGGADGKYKKEFPGDNWQECVRDNGEAIVEAFRNDTAECLGVPHKSIVVKSTVPDEEGVRFGYVIANQPEGITDNYIASHSEDYPYPALWALYAEAGMTTTPHALTFVADGWDYIVRRRRWELARAIADDCAEVLMVTPDTAVDMHMSVTPEELNVIAQLQHTETLKAETIDVKLNESPFTRVWDLYEKLAPSPEMQKRFDGPAWLKINSELHEELERAFTDDVARCFGVSRLEVNVISTQATNDSLYTRFVVHGGNVQEDHAQAHADAYAFPNTWALYRSVDAASSSGDREKNFPGEKWDYVLGEKRPEVVEAFQQDVANALSIPKDSVEVSSAHADPQRGLVTNFRVNDMDAAAVTPAGGESVEERIENYDYPHLWNLYQETLEHEGLGDAGERESGELERVFEGDDWDLILNLIRGDAEDAFRKDTANALGLHPSSVIVLDSRLGSLIVLYKVCGCPDNDDEIMRKAAAYEYPELMGLYKSRMRAGDEGAAAGSRGISADDTYPVETFHQVGFDGEDWAYVVNTQGDALKKAFAEDASAALGLKPEQIDSVKPTVDKQLLLNFAVRHSEAMSKADVNSILKICDYKKVWALYGTHPYARGAVQTTDHSVGFEGDDWDYVISIRREDVINAFKAGTGRALLIPESDIVKVVIESSHDGIVLTCNLLHEPERPAAELQDELQRYPYEEMWALYTVRPYDEAEKITTLHDLDFEGASWGIVAELEGDQLRQAIIQDTAAALDVEESDILKVTVNPSAEKMTVRVEAQHSPLQDRELIQEMLQKSGYENVWALYETSLESAMLCKSFDGFGWIPLVKDSRAEIEEAFAKDAGEMLNLPPRFMKIHNVVDVDGDHMEVYYSVFGNWYVEDDMQARSETYAFPETWALYKEIEYEPKPYQMVFNGEEWERLLPPIRNDVVDAFSADTADAMNTRADNVEVTSMFANKENGLIVNFTFKTPVGDDVEDRVASHAYPRVWELFDNACDQAERLNPNLASGLGSLDRESGELERVFKGDDWDIVLDNRRSQAEEAFCRGTADALGVSPSDVIVTDARIGSLIVNYKVRGCDVDDADIDRKVQDYDYPELMQLYQPRMRFGAEGDENKAREVAPMAAKMDDDDGYPVESKHSISFEGDEWAWILDRKPEEIKEAIRADSAEAIGVPDENISDIHLSAQRTELHAAVTILHTPSQTKEEVQEKLTENEYERVWALYCPPSEAPHAVKMFQGDWSAVDAEAVKAAYIADCASAVGVTASDIEIESHTCDLSAMTMVAVLHFCAAEQDDVDREIDACEFPTVWALFPTDTASRGIHELPAAAPHRKDFPGDQWEQVLNKHRADVEDAFKNDTASALFVPEDKVDVTSLYSTKNALVVNFQVPAVTGGRSHEEMAKAVEACEYLGVWELYQDEGSAFNKEGMNTTKDDLCQSDLSVNFEGKHWDYVLEIKAEELAEAFKADTARALSVEPQAVNISEFVVGSLLVLFHVSHPADISESVMREKLDAYPYDEVWALYVERPSAESTAHDIGFEANNWEYVEMRKHSDIIVAFQQATARACNIPEGSVTDVSTATYPNMMKISCTIAHGADVDAAAVNGAINTYPYFEVWNLYEETPAGRQSGPLRKTFEGENWGDVLHASPVALSEAFRTDAMTCLKIPRSAVTIDTVSLGSLIVDYRVQTAGMSNEQVKTALEKYPFPEVWSMYKPCNVTRDIDESYKGGEAATHQRFFSGRYWDLVVARARNELHNAFIEDTAETIPTDMADVLLYSLYTTSAGLVINYTAEKPRMSSDEIQEAVLRGDYPRVWELYRQFADSEYEHSDHAVGFDGEDWDYVLERHCEVLLHTFTMCTAEALGLQSKHIISVVPIYANRRISFEFTVRHPMQQTPNVITRALRDHKYEPVWELYETRPYDPARIIITSHEITFEGEDWDYSLGNHVGAMKDAFTHDAAEALQVDAEDITGFRMERGDCGVVVGVNVCHSPLQDADMIREQIQNCPFTRVWDLYNPRSLPGGPEKSASQHQVGFEGPNWENVMAQRHAALLKALRADTAVALGGKPEDITELFVEESPTMMTTTMKVQHDVNDAPATVQRKLSVYKYPQVWALYDDVVTQHVDVMKVRLDWNMSGSITKRFDGTDWDLAMSEYPDRLRDAFIKDTAEVLQCSDVNVVVDGMMLGSLVVQARVRDLPIPDEKAQYLCDNYAYPSVWGLYRSRTDSAAPRLAAPPAPESVKKAQLPPQPPSGLQSERHTRELPPQDDGEEAADAANREAAEAQRAAEEDEAAKQAEEDAKKAEDAARAREEAAKQALEKAKTEKERLAKEAEEEAKRAEEAARRAAEEDEAAKQAEEDAKKAEDAARAREEAAKQAAEKAKVEGERRAREAEEEAVRVEEAARRAAEEDEAAKQAEEDAMRAAEAVREREEAAKEASGKAKAEEERRAREAEVEAARAEEAARQAAEEEAAAKQAEEEAKKAQEDARRREKAAKKAAALAKTEKERRAKEAEEEAKRVAEAARKAAEADAAAKKAEEDAKKAIAAARKRREAAQRAADEAKADEERRAREAEEDAKHHADAVKKAADADAAAKKKEEDALRAAEDARQRREAAQQAAEDARASKNRRASVAAEEAERDASAARQAADEGAAAKRAQEDALRVAGDARQRREAAQQAAEDARASKNRRASVAAEEAERDASAARQAADEGAAAKRAQEDALRVAGDARQRREAAQQAAEDARASKNRRASVAAEEAKRHADAARQAADEDAAAKKAANDAKKAGDAARKRREAAEKAAKDAQAEEDRRARESLSEAERAVEAAKKAADAAEEAKRRRVKPLDGEEKVEEEESIKYLRKALADARKERDQYQEMVDTANRRDLEGSAAAS